MIEDTNGNNIRRYCKKCGGELPSTEKYDLCINCRRERGLKIRNTVFTFFAVIGSVFVGQQFIKKADDTFSEDDNEEDDDYSHI